MFPDLGLNLLLGATAIKLALFILHTKRQLQTFCGIRTFPAVFLRTAVDVAASEQRGLHLAKHLRALLAAYFLIFLILFLSAKACCECALISTFIDVRKRWPQPQSSDSSWPSFRRGNPMDMRVCQTLHCESTMTEKIARGLVAPIHFSSH